MSDFIEISYNLFNAISYYKKKKDVSKLHQVLICISDKSAEDFAELTLQGYFEKKIKKNKKKFLGNFKPNSKKGVKLIGDIKKDLTSYFVTLIEIMNSNKIPLSDVKVKQEKLLDEMKEILNMETSEFYNDYILRNIEIENRISKKKTKETFDLLSYSSLLNEERITLGYFLLFEKLYGADSSNKNYYYGPFFDESYPPNCDEINKQHNNLIQALYPQKNTFKASSVIETLIYKNLLVENEGRWSKSKKTFWQSTINYNFGVMSEKSIQKIANETALLITKLIKKYSSNDDILVELLLLEEGVPEDVLEKAIKEKFKELKPSIIPKIEDHIKKLASNQLKNSYERVLNSIKKLSPGIELIPLQKYLALKYKGRNIATIHTRKSFFWLISFKHNEEGKFEEKVFAKVVNGNEVEINDVIDTAKNIIKMVD